MNIVERSYPIEEIFSDLEAIILPIFNRTPVSNQPKYIVHTECRDGRLLKKIYELIRNKTLRGKVLNHHPISFIGVDTNETLLKKTAQNLNGIDHVTIKGSAKQSNRILESLYDIIIQDTENILYIYSITFNSRLIALLKNIIAKVKLSKNECDVAVFSANQTHEKPFNGLSVVIATNGLIAMEVQRLGQNTVK